MISRLSWYVTIVAVLCSLTLPASVANAEQEQNVDRTLAIVGEKLIWLRDVYALYLFDHPKMVANKSLTVDTETMDSYTEVAVRFELVKIYYKRVGSVLYKVDESAQSYWQRFLQGIGGEKKLKDVSERLGASEETLREQAISFVRAKDFLKSLGTQEEVTNWLKDQRKRTNVRRF